MTASSARPTHRNARVLALVATLALAGCSIFEAQPQLRGNRVDPEQIQQLVPGTSSKADVTALIGSPTARATFDDNTWLYVSSVTKPRIGRTQGVLSQDVTVVTFNDQGMLQEVKKLTQDDSIPVTMVARSTPSPGTEASFLQQLFGNIGRFNAFGSSVPTTGPSGGAPRPAY